MTLITGWLLIFGLGMSNNLITKKISWSVNKNRNNYLFFVLLNSLTACGVFFVLSRFHIEYSHKDFFCAVIYAALLLAGFPISFARIRLTDVTTATVLGTAGGLVTSFLMGSVVFDEDITVIGVCRIFLVLATVFLVFLNERRLVEKKHKKSAIKPLVWLTLLAIFVNCLSTLLQKYYANTSDASNRNSYFFFTNLVMAAVILPIVLWRMFRCSGGPVEMLKSIPYRCIPLYMSNTLVSNITSVVSMFLLAEMALSVYAPISSAIGILAGMAASLILRERLTIYSLLAAGISLIAVIL